MTVVLSKTRLCERLRLLITTIEKEILVSTVTFQDLSSSKQLKHLIAAGTAAQWEVAKLSRTVTTYRELMQEQVHEEGYFVAVQYVGAVDRAAGARQVVRVDGGAEGPGAEEEKTQSSRTSTRVQRTGPRASGLGGTGEDYRLSSARANTLSRICGSLRAQFVFAGRRHISLTSAGEGVRREE